MLAGALFALVATPTPAAEPTASGTPFPEIILYDPIDFEDVPTTQDSDRRLPSGYRGLIWSNIGILDTQSPTTTPSGYLNLANSPAGSGSQVIYTGGGEPASILAPADQTFGVRSVGVAAAWNDQLNVVIRGLRDGEVVQGFEQTVQLDTGAPQTVILDFHDIDELSFESSGGIPAPGLASSGTQLAIDQIVQPPTPVAGPFRNHDTGHDYYLLSPGDWQRCEDTSRRFGGHLVTINDQAELDWLLATFGIGSPLWIGLNDRAVEGSFEWTDGGSSSVAPWTPGQPDALDPGDDGVAMDPLGEWSDQPLESSFYGIIEVDPPHVLGGPVRRAETGHDYYLVSPQTWTLHADFARRHLGGLLATIDDIGEQQWIVDQFGGGDRWFGLNDADAEGLFRWQDGVAAGSFSNWLGHGDDHLVARWSLDETAGTTAADPIGGHTGQLGTGVSWNPGGGKVGGAAEFTGSGSRIDLPAVDVPGTAITVCGWVKPSSFDGVASEGRIISKATGLTDDEHYWMLGNYLDGTAPRFRLKTSERNETIVGPAGLLAIGQWSHIAGTYDGSRIRIYVDGTEVASDPLGGTLPSAPAVAVAIGNQPTGIADRGFPGSIDEVMVFDRALEAVEIATLAAAAGLSSIENPGNPGVQDHPPAFDELLNHAFLDPSGTWDLDADPGTHRLAVVEVIPGPMEEFAFTRGSPAGEPLGGFGTTLATAGTWLAVGAPGEAGGAGRVHLFDFAGPTPGLPVHTFSNPDPANLEGFGTAVDLDGDRLAIGALPAPASTTGGSVTVHDLTLPFTDPPIATFADPDPSAGHRFGASIDLAGDLLAVGGWRENTDLLSPGGAWVLDLGAPANPPLALTPPFPTSDNRYGSAVAISGELVLVGSPGDGTLPGSVAIHDLAGAAPETAVEILDSPTPSPGDQFGARLAGDDYRAVVTSPGDSWDAAGTGAAHVFDFSEGISTFPAVILRNPTPGAGDAFGSSVALLDDLLLVGTPMDDDGASDAGTSYLFDLSGAFPTALAARFTEPAPAATRHFGTAVAITPSRIIIAADTGAEGDVLVFGPSPEIRVADADDSELPSGILRPLIQVAIDAHYDHPLTIENLGLGLLEGVEASLTGPDAAEFLVAEAPSEEIKAGKASGLVLRFAPTSGGSKSVTLSLRNTDEDERPYLIDFTAEALPARTLFDNWAAAAGLSGADAEPEAIPFADGLPNLLKYAFNLDGSKIDAHPLDPDQGDSGRFIAFTRMLSGAEVVRFQYVRRRGSGLVYTPTFSETLAPGSFVAGLGTTYVDPVDDQWERISIDDPFDLDTVPAGFGVLEVNLPE